MSCCTVGLCRAGHLPGPFLVLSQQWQSQLLAVGEHSPSCLEPREGRL